MMGIIIAMNLAAVSSDARTAGSGARKTRWGTLRVQGLLTTPLSNNQVEGWNNCGSGWLDYLSFYSSINVNTSEGVLANFEYVVAGKYGFGIDLMYWREIVELHFAATGTTVDGSPNFIMPTIGMNYHFVTDGKRDIYAGALCALGVLATGFYTDIEVSKDVALGLNLGIDYYVKRSWSLGATLKYIDFGELDFSVLPSGMEGIICNNGLFGVGHMNFVSLTFGIGYRF